MQRIRSTRWPVKNIGGDRAYCKLRYVKGANFGIAQGDFWNGQNQVMGIATAPSGSNLFPTTLHAIMGDTPNLSTMGQLYQFYRIRGVKLRLTYWQISGAPCFLFAQAVPDQGQVSGSDSAPNPDFINPSIVTLPEQRWGKYRVCQATAAGGRASSLSVYYSVNKVQGPDTVVRNDADYIGQMSPTTPYWDQGTAAFARPTRSPWMQWGLSTLSGNPTTAQDVTTGVLKVEQTVYCEFFGKRPQTQ